MAFIDPFLDTPKMLKVSNFLEISIWDFYECIKIVLKITSENQPFRILLIRIIQIRNSVERRTKSFRKRELVLKNWSMRNGNDFHD